MIVCLTLEYGDAAANISEVFNSFKVNTLYAKAKEDDEEASIINEISIYVNNYCWKIFEKNPNYSFNDIYRITKLVRKIILAEAHTDKILYLDDLWDKAVNALFNEDEDDFEEMYADE